MGGGVVITYSLKKWFLPHYHKTNLKDREETFLAIGDYYFIIIEIPQNIMEPTSGRIVGDCWYQLRPWGPLSDPNVCTQSKNDPCVPI